MMDTKELTHEESLDPQDWAALRELGHQMLDDLFTQMETIRDEPVWQPVSPEVKAFFQQPLPRAPTEQARLTKLSSSGCAREALSTPTRAFGAG